MFAGDISHRQRLDDPVLPDRFDQLGQRFPGKILPRLQRARDDGRKFDLLNFLARLSLEPNTRGPRADQCAETFPESRLCHARQVIGSGSWHKTALVVETVSRRSANVRGCTTAPSPWVIPPILTTRSCFTPWRKTRSICAVTVSNIGWKISRR